jgi:hypothetical protein
VKDAHETWQDTVCFIRLGEGNAFMDDSRRSLVAVKGGDVPGSQNASVSMTVSWTCPFGE